MVRKTSDRPVNPVSSAWTVVQAWRPPVGRTLRFQPQDHPGAGRNDDFAALDMSAHPSLERYRGFAEIHVMESDPARFAG